VITSSVCPRSQIDHSLFESKKKAADANGYLVATKSGFATQSSPMNEENFW
jgi:hypothetical protein